MQKVKGFLRAAGAFICAVAAFLVSAANAVVSFIKKMNDTYKGYVNFPELLAVFLTALASGRSAREAVLAVAAHSSTIFTNVDPAAVDQWVTITVGALGILARLQTGSKISKPSERQANPRTR